MRSGIRRLSVAALLGASAALSVVGCSSNGTDKPQTASTPGSADLGSVGLKLQVAPNANVDTIHYVVTKNGAAIDPTKEPGFKPVGDIPVPGNNKDFIFALTLPVGTGYGIALSAKWDDPDDADTLDGTPSLTDPAADITCTGSAGPFDITPGGEIGISAPMLCKDVGSGNVIIGVDVASTACPDLHPVYSIATPKATTIGTPVSVLSSATDDVAGTPIAYKWTVTPAAAGSFANANTANTTFNCATASPSGGFHTLTVTFTAGTGASACTDSLNVQVSCANLLCGNGVVDPGETCDDSGAPGGCPNDCTQVCGDNNQEGTEACDYDSLANPTGTATCKVDCTVRTASCGDGFVTSPETCDDANTVSGDGCSSTCAIEAAAVCGDGVKSSSEACDPTAAPGSTWNCSGANPTAANACKVVATAACEAQEGPCKDPSALAGCTDPQLNTPAKQQACYDLLLCMRSTKCATTAPEPCLCGTLDTASCAALAAGTAPGPCAAQMAAAMGSNVPNTELANFGAVTQPGAHAVARVLCDEAVAPACLL